MPEKLENSGAIFLGGGLATIAEQERAATVGILSEILLSALAFLQRGWLSRRQSDVEIAGFDAAFIADQCNALGEGTATGVEIELPLMPGACHAGAVHFASGEVATGVRATVLGDDEAIGI